MSDTFGPFNVRPGVLQRSTNFQDLVLRQREGTTAYRLWVSPTIEDAYGTLANSGLAGTGGTNMLEVAKGSLGMTDGPRVRGWRVEESRRGQTSFLVDPRDVPLSDDVVIYHRVQEQRMGNWLAVPGAAILNPNTPISGPILVVPPAPFFAAAASVLSLQSIAPLMTGCTAGALPVVDETVQTPLPMHLVFPRPASTIIVRNLSVGDTLLVSFGLGMPMIEVAPGEATIPTGGGYALPGVREIVVASWVQGQDAVPFSVEATIGMQV